MPRAQGSGRGPRPRVLPAAAVAAAAGLLLLLLAEARPAEGWLFTSSSGATRPEPRREELRGGGPCQGLGDRVDMREAVREAVPRDKAQALVDRGATHESGNVLENYEFASCAVVGNGGVLGANSHGKAIDSHTAVFRANQAPTRGYEAKTGKKTQFRVLNKTWLAKYAAGSSWPTEKGVGLVTSRGKGGDVAKLVRARAAAVPGGGRRGGD